MPQSPIPIDKIIEFLQNIPNYLATMFGLDFDNPQGPLEKLGKLLINVIGGILAAVSNLMAFGQIVEVLLKIIEVVAQAFPDRWSLMQFISSAFILLAVSSGVGFVALRAMENMPVLPSPFGIQEAMTVVFFMFLGSLPITLLRPAGQLQKFLSTIIFGAGVLVVLVTPIFSAMGAVLGGVLLLTLGVMRNPNSQYRFVIESLVPLTLMVLIYLFLASYTVGAALQEENAMHVLYFLLLTGIALVFAAQLIPRNEFPRLDI